MVTFTEAHKPVVSKDPVFISQQNNVLQVIRPPTNQQKLEIISKREKLNHPNLEGFKCKVYGCGLVTWSSDEPKEGCLHEHPEEWPQGKQLYACFYGHPKYVNKRELLWLKRIEQCEICKNILETPSKDQLKEAALQRLTAKHINGLPVLEKSGSELLQEVEIKKKEADAKILAKAIVEELKPILTSQQEENDRMTEDGK